MTDSSPISARIQLDSIDLDRIDTSEVVIPDSAVMGGKVISVTRFGWTDDLSVVSSDPDRLEAFAEAFLDAAKNLRIAKGETPVDDELAAFPRSA